MQSPQILPDSKPRNPLPVLKQRQPARRCCALPKIRLHLPGNGMAYQY
jgi:hypothetical protein